MSLATAVPVALAAAAAYGAASAVQAAEADRLSIADPTNSGLRALARRPLWLLGVVADIVGLILHVFALTLGPASLIQPLQVTGLLLALPLARYLRSDPARHRAAFWRDYVDAELVAALLLVAGLGMFLAGTRPRVSTISVGAAGIAALLAAAFTVQGLASFVSRGLGGRLRSLTLGSAAGASFAITSVLVDSLARQRRLHGWSVLLTTSSLVTIIGAVGVGLGALSVSQRAFQSGPLSQSLPAITVVDPLIAVVLGGTLLGETPHLGVPNLLLDAVALIAVSAAVHALAHPRVSPSRQSDRSPASHRRTESRASSHPGVVRAGVAAAGIGAGYGLLAAVLATLVDVRTDTDGTMGTRLLILLTCVAAAAVINVASHLWRSHQANPPA